MLSILMHFISFLIFKRPQLPIEADGSSQDFFGGLYQVIYMFLIVIFYKPVLGGMGIEKCQ